MTVSEVRKCISGSAWVLVVPVTKLAEQGIRKSCTKVSLFGHDHHCLAGAGCRGVGRAGFVRRRLCVEGADLEISLIDLATTFSMKEKDLRLYLRLDSNNKYTG
jgi:hypothetical protein